MAADRRRAGPRGLSALFSDIRWRPADKWILLGVFLLSALFYADFVRQERLPHSDALGSFNLSFNFLNDLLTYGIFTKWLPLHGHGTTVNYLMNFGLSLFTPVEALLSLLFPKISTFTWGYLGLALDELLLIFGTFLCCKRYFKSAWTHLFVLGAMAGSVLCVHNTTAGLHLFYLMPWMLYFIQSGFAARSTARLIFSLSPLFLSTIGGVGYSIPVHLMFWLVFFIAGLSRLTRADYPVFLANARAAWKANLAALAFLLAAMGYLYIFAKVGSQDIVVNVPGRNGDGLVSLEDFLHSTGSSPPIKYLELLTGLNLDYDLSIFCGFLTLYFGLYAFGTLRARRTPAVPWEIPVVTLLTMNFTAAGSVATWAYDLVPFMNRFRHIETVAAFVRVWFILLAGFGFERFTAEVEKHRRLLLVPLLGTLASWYAIHFDLARGSRYFHDIWRGVPPLGANPMEEAFSADTLRSVEQFWQIYLAALAVVLFACWFDRRLRKARTFAILMVALNLVSVLTYKGWFSSIVAQSTRGSGIWSLYRRQPFPYLPTRTLDYSESPRFRTYADQLYWKKEGPAFPLSPENRFTFPGIFPWGPVGNIQQDFGAILQVDDCLTLSRARFHRGVFNFITSQGGFPKTGEKLSDNYLRAAGCGYEKVQFFLYALADESEADRRLRTGQPLDGLFVHWPGRETGLPAGAPINHYDPAKQAFVYDAKATPRKPTELHYDVKSFDDNHLTLAVRSADQFDVMLYYADAWDRAWKAFVDGQEVPVLRANLGYKAVPVTSHSVVEFRLVNDWQDLMYLLLFGCMTVMIVVLAAGVWSVLRVRP